MYWLFELRVEPDLERVGEEGFALHIQVTEQHSIIHAEYWLWRGILFGPPTKELRSQPSHQLAPGEAIELLDELRQVKLTPLPPSEVWLHPVTHRLEIHSGFSSTTFVWQEHLPEQWSEFTTVVRRLKQIVKDHPSEV